MAKPSPSDPPMSDERDRRSVGFKQGSLGDPPTQSDASQRRPSNQTKSPNPKLSTKSSNLLRGKNPSKSPANVPLPPSVLRNPGGRTTKSPGDSRVENNLSDRRRSSSRSPSWFPPSDREGNSPRYEKISGINGGFSSSGNKHIDLRRNRLTAMKRAMSDKDFSHMSFGNKAGYFITKTVDGISENIPKRYRSAVTLTAFAGLVGIICSSIQPVMNTSLKSATNRSSERSLVADNPEGGLVSDDFDQRRRRAADLPDGTVFSEPAHTRMCRAILNRLDAFDAGATNFEEAIFTESEYVCRDPDAPYTSVMNMFAAQLLNSASDEIGLNVQYTHRCAKWERFCSGNMTTIQMNLPDPLSVNSYSFQQNCVNGPMLRTICKDCLTSGSTSPDCVLFPNGYLQKGTNTCDLGCYFSQVLPWIRNNLRTVATTWLSTVETRALTFWLRNAAEFGHREKDDMEVAAVYLSCANEDCDMTHDSCLCEFNPLPNWVYALQIPRSSTNIAVIVSPTCAKFGEGCTLHAQEIHHFFQSLYPRADITYNVITSTSSAYMRMITADHLVCPPGVGCLLPAISRDAYTYVYEKTTPTVSTWLTCVPNAYLSRMTIPNFPPEFFEGDCRHLRARIGVWTPDVALAPSMQYSNPVDGYLGCADSNFAPSAEVPYRSPTTYRWDESIWATCPVSVMSKEELCKQMDRLGLNSIFFVGDHTTMTQAISLASVLGQNNNISLDPNVVPNFIKTVTCSGTTTITSFSLSYVRNDRLEEPGTIASPGNPNCGPNNEQYCYPWSGDYANHFGRQLLIVNTGYHWADDWEGYITNFQNFVGKIDDVAAGNPARTNDIVMFRTSIPGHKECDLHDSVYLHYQEYCPRIVNGAFWHWWGELPPYNDYAIRIINEWNLLNTVKNGPDIELLDPWMMTILRPDGHLSGSDAGPNCAIDPKECMLYSLPGPVDWWNHLLVMQLRDIRTHQENSSPTVVWR